MPRGVPAASKMPKVTTEPRIPTIADIGGPPMKVPSAPAPTERNPSAWSVKLVEGETDVYEFYCSASGRSFTGAISEPNAIINPRNEVKE